MGMSKEQRSKAALLGWRRKSTLSRACATTDTAFWLVADIRDEKRSERANQLAHRAWYLLVMLSIELEGKG